MPRELSKLGCLLMLGALALHTAAGRAAGNDIRLLAEAQVPGPGAAALRLADVAALSGPEAAALGEVVVATLPAGAAEGRCTLESVRAALTQHGVNWGRVSLRGPAVCRVLRLAEPAPAPPNELPLLEPAPASPVPAGPQGAMLRDQLLDMFAALAGAAPADLRVAFADGDAADLALAAAEYRFELQPLSATGLGRVPVTVRCWRGEKLERTLRLSAEVSRRHVAAVARRSIGRGETLSDEHVELREVYLAESAGEVVSDLSQALGREAVTLIRQDGVVYTQQLRPALLVRRGELITVRVRSGGVVLAAPMRAMDDAALGEPVRVRREDGRDVLTARVAGPRAAVMVVGPAMAAAGPEHSSPFGEGGIR